MNAQTPRRFVGFLKSTVIGGIFVLFPIVVLLVIVGKTAGLAYDAVQPIVEYVPFLQTASGIAVTVGIAVGAAILLCFLAGLLARTTLADWAIKRMEMVLLSNLPGYGLMKSMGQGMVGADRGEQRQAVMARFEHSSQLGFLMERLDDDRVVVFIPGVPNPWSGTLHVMAADRVELLQVSTHNAIDCLQRLGVDGKRLLGRSENH